MKFISGSDAVPRGEPQEAKSHVIVRPMATSSKPGSSSFCALYRYLVSVLMSSPWLVVGSSECCWNVGLLCCLLHSVVMPLSLSPTPVLLVSFSIGYLIGCNVVVLGEICMLLMGLYARCLCSGLSIRSSYLLTFLSHVLVTKSLTAAVIRRL